MKNSGSNALRTFIAIEIDEALRERIAEWQNVLRESFPRLKWTDARRIHLTLKFLGEIEEGQADDVRGMLDSIATTTAPFSMGIRKTGVFPPAGPPRVVWIGVKEATGALVQLQGAVEAGAVELSFVREDRSFHPHLTVARCSNPSVTRDLRRALYDHRNFDAGEMQVRQIVFMQSTLTRTGPIYTPISEHELKG